AAVVDFGWPRPFAEGDRVAGAVADLCEARVTVPAKDAAILDRETLCRHDRVGPFVWDDLRARVVVAAAEGIAAVTADDSARIGIGFAVIAGALQNGGLREGPDVVGKRLDLNRINLVVQGLLLQVRKQRRPASEHEAM